MKVRFTSPRTPDFRRLRRCMVRDQLDRAGRDITDPRVLEVMARLPRHEFVPVARRSEAYADHPIPIGHGQTISQPYIVALMTGILDPRPGDRILEIGTGSGYQAAVLARLGARVHSMEILEPLAREAEGALRRLGITGVVIRIGDGHRGWPEAAPFDGIILTCAPAEGIPQALVDQLRDGGRIVGPVGDADQGQELVLLEKRGGRLSRSLLLPVRFVPMTGGANG